VKSSRILAALIVSIVAALSLCANAGAANVLVGPSLTGSWETEECGVEACTYINDDSSGTATDLRAPVDGAIVRFSLVGGSTAGAYRIGTALKFGKAGFTFVNWGAPVASSPTAGVQSFPTVLPVRKGMWISLTMSETASLGFREGTGQLVGWGFEPFESESPAETESEIFPEELAGFDAEIQPAPTVASLGTTSGPTAGGTSVTINGTDLENATSVTFGSSPAASYVVNSESQITAVAPANASAASVSVTVTTIAGKAIASQQFGYVAPPPPPVVTTPAPTLKKTTPKPAKQCLVPNLKGKKLPVAKAALKKADCKAGKVTKLKGATPKTGKVAAQSRKAGAKAAAGAKVNLTLKP
jgi:hypothetical protein